MIRARGLRLGRERLWIDVRPGITPREIGRRRPNNTANPLIKWSEREDSTMLSGIA